MGRIRVFLALVFLFLGLAIPAQAQAASFFFSTSGSNSNYPCPSTAPCADPSAFTFGPDDKVRLARNEAFPGVLSVNGAGTAATPILVNGWGPLGPNPQACLTINASDVDVTNVDANNCPRAGFNITGDRVELFANEARNSFAGIETQPGATETTIRNNEIHDNTDYQTDNGAFGILLHGDHASIRANIITGHYITGTPFGADGAAIEVYDGQFNEARKNTSINNESFVELGSSNPAIPARSNTFAYNRVVSSLESSQGLVTRGSLDGFGPVNATRFINNTVSLTGALSDAAVCFGGCSATILKIHNNVLRGTQHGIWADASPEDGGNVYYPDAVGVTLNNSVVATPQFVNEGTGDLHLADGAPGIDRGAPVPGFPYIADIEGNPVPQDGNGDGTPAIDSGAYEHPTVEPPPPGSGVIVAVGDTSCCGGTGDAGGNDAATATLAAAQNPDAVLHLGDFQYQTGTTTAINNDYDKSWGALKPKTYTTFGGSHDCYQEPDGTCGLHAYFNNGGPRQQANNVEAFSVDIAGQRFISMPSYCANDGRCGTSSSSAFNSFLAAQLQNAPACTTVFWHKPYYSDSSEGHSASGTPPKEGDGDAANAQTWYRTAYDGNADLLLVGHQHGYERWKPMNPWTDAVDTARGIPEFIVGTGGTGDYAWLGFNQTYVAFQAPTPTFGILKLTLSSNSIGFQFINTAGNVLDSGTVNCH